MNRNALGPTLDRLEQSRQANLRTLIAVPAILAVLTCALTLVFHGIGWLPARNNTLLFGLGAAFFCMRYLINRAKTDFKRQILPALLSETTPDLSYNSSAHIELATFEQSSLYKAPDRFSGKDLVQGRIGATHIRFSLVLAQEKTRPQVATSRKELPMQLLLLLLSYLPITRRFFFRPLFSGVFFCADFNKHFSGRTMLRKPSLKILNALFGGAESVELEDPQFNQRFNVRSTDQVEARYLLTPSLMERLQQLHDQLGGFQAALTNGQLLLAIPCAQDAFEPDIFQSLHAPGQLERISTVLRNLTGIVEALDLNTRIWSKDDPFAAGRR